MAEKKVFKGVVLISILVLPFLVYFIFVYSVKEVFFVTLDYAGPREVTPSQTEEGAWDTSYYFIPDFSYTTQDDSTLTSEDLKGKIYLANFFFTTCPSICPAMNYNVQQVQERFKGYEDFRIVSFSVDPNHDQPEVLKAYESTIGARSGLWYFLTGDEDAIHETALHYFQNASKDSLADGGFLHSENLVLVDWEGRIRSGRDDQGNVKGAYDGLSPDEIKSMKEDIKVLIAEYEKHKSVEEYRASKKNKNGGE